MVAPHAPLDRDELMEALHGRSIGTGVHYRGVHLHPYYRDRYALKSEDFPIASDMSQRTLSLPLGANVSDTDQDDVVAALAEALA
jgi:dTDP-4-amino-4,6-dideoxygalactose transaminase